MEMPGTRTDSVLIGLSLLLALAGIGVAGYLTYAAFDTEILSCSFGDCGTVQNSSYARLGGIPIALFGVGMYLSVVGLLGLRLFRADLSLAVLMAAFAIVLAGALYSGWLTYIEIRVIEAICQWCVISALLTLALVGTIGALTWREITRESFIESE